MTDNHDDDRDEDRGNDPKKPEDNDDDDVGYCKPPKKHWFKPGQSGNPKGRKRGSRGLKTDLKAELNSRVTITENGRTISLTKQQVIIKSLATKAAKGDVKAANSIVALTIQMHGIEDERVGKTQVSAADAAILADYLASIAGSSEPPPGWPSEPTKSSDADDIEQPFESGPYGHLKPGFDDYGDGTDEGGDDSYVDDYGEEYDDDD